LEEHFAKQEAAKIYQLAFWPDEKRAMPADFIACALFSGIQEKDATYVDDLEIANANDLSIVFKGRRLTQVHADVWQGIMHLARQLPEGAKVRFRARQFLRVIGRQTGQKQRNNLKGWFTDLTATSVTISDTKKNRRFWGSLLPNGATQEDTNDTVYVVEINKQLAKLFGAENLGAVNWEVRQRLFKKPLALWWQFYSSKFTKPVPVAELHRLSGSGSTLKEFRRKLGIAMRAVEEAGGSSSYIDKVTDTAIPTPRARVSAGVVVPTMTLPGGNSGPAVSEAAKTKFQRSYPGADVEECLGDWRKWLSKTGKTADAPDLAFLGFAKRWQPAALRKSQRGS
jgi:TrfA protein